MGGDRPAAELLLPWQAGGRLGHCGTLEQQKWWQLGTAMGDLTLPPNLQPSSGTLLNLAPWLSLKLIQLD